MLTNSTVPATPGPTLTKKRGLNTKILAIVIIVVVVAGVVVSLFVASFLIVTKASFASYSTPVSQNSSSPSSLTVTDVNGGVSLLSQSGTDLTINGTITARGLGSSADAISFVKSSSNRAIVFQAVFPSSGLGFFLFATYTVDINIYVPVSGYFSSIQVTTTNGNVQASTVVATSLTLTTTNGNIKATTIDTSTLTLRSTNGNIEFACFCTTVTASTANGSVTSTLTYLSPTGSYTLTTTNGNINLTFPASAASFKITANTTNGTVSSSGLAVQITNHNTATFGTGGATVILTTVNGSVTIAGS